MEGEQYKAFVKEAFIDSIRSVLIVDDDYPTFEEVLKRQVQLIGDNGTDEEKEWYRSPSQVKKVIDKFRAADPSLLVDIHDGSNVGIGEEVKAAKHLHQSDLLVLDYELDRNNRGDGTKAIEIARNVMVNDHFNLVIVHTKEDLDQVFRDMLIGVMGKASPFITEEERNRVNELIGIAEIDDEGITERLKTSMSVEHYLHFRNSDCVFPPNATDDAPSYDVFSSICREAGWAANEVLSQIARWALAERESQLAAKFNKSVSPGLSWSSGNRKWIRSDTVFVAFSNKGQGDDLLDELLNTLTAWVPRPSRLFLAILRAQIEKFGVVAESSALGNNHVLAHWYSRLLEEDGAARDFHISESVSRHSQQLLDFILPQVTEFACRLVSADAADEDSKSLCNAYFGVDLKDDKAAAQAKNEHNAFVCSKKVEGYHLATGHVFKAREGHWVCLSPLCDLVPGQVSTTHYGDIGKNLPFMAVRLQPVQQPASKDGQKKWKKWQNLVQSNRLIFLRLEGSIKAYCISDPENEGSAPHWFGLYAKNNGNFDEDNKSFRFLMMEVAGNHRPVLRQHDAEVVGQLRYEYALNLMQRLGATMTRVGLDFVGV